jgi:hypothetical protein
MPGVGGFVGARRFFESAALAGDLHPRREEKEGGISDWLSAYHAVLALKRAPTGFRGINGFLPAKTRVPSIYSTVPSSRA